MTMPTETAIAPTEPTTTNEQPRSLRIADAGIHMGTQMTGLMSAMISDLVAGRLSPQIGNAVCNAAGKLLKVVEMQYKYGNTDPNRPQDLLLAPAPVDGNK